jgi:dihydroflavonol-4-reductase
MAQVLVTGGTGFLASHCLLRLLGSGHDVRTTVRSLARQEQVRLTLRRGGAGSGADRVSFVTTDLTADEGWAQAVQDCDYVLHVASPFPSQAPKDENELIVPSRDGTLRVLRAARDSGVKRVVLTSSFAAIGYGAKHRERPFTEADWTDARDPSVQPYQRSKTIAERAAWDFIDREGRGLELAVINPVGILGPVLGPDYSTSIHLVKRMIEGSTPGCPNLWFGFVDVRDVADLHLLAMTSPAARGERFLATAGHFLSVQQAALVLRNGLHEAGKAVSTRRLPNWLLRIAGLFDPEIRGMLPELGKRKDATADKARRLLNWRPRSPQDAILSTANSLLALGLLDGPPGTRRTSN